MQYTVNNNLNLDITLDFLLLKWKIPRKPFLSALLKLEVLERMESTKIKSYEWERKVAGQRASWQYIFVGM